MLVNVINFFKAKEGKNPFKQQVESKVVGEPPKSLGDSQILFQTKAGMSGLSEPPNLSTTTDVSRIQAALRSAERGEPWQLFTIYRDLQLGFTHLQTEWSKRKIVVLGQRQSLVPHDKENPDDVIAAKVIQEMIEGCPGWYDALDHLLDATLYPLSAAEKIFEPVNGASNESYYYTQPIRYRLKAIMPISYTLLCFRIPYISSGSETNPVLKFNPDDWEAKLRFFAVEPSNGKINYTTADVYKPNPDEHIIHRGNFLSKVIPDNYGGQMRAILFWWLLATQGRDWMAVYMQKYGSPFLVGKVNSQNPDAVNLLNNAFQLSQQVGGIVVDTKDAIEVVQAAASDGANAHKTLINLCNSEVSKVVLGQELSSTAKNTGMGSGMSDLHGEVREDFRMFDTTKLADTLARQLFVPYLKLNGYKGRPPHIHWGASREPQALQIAQTLNQLYAGGIRPTEGGLSTLNDKFGFEIESFDPNEGKDQVGENNGTGYRTKTDKAKA